MMQQAWQSTAVAKGKKYLGAGSRSDIRDFRGAEMWKGKERAASAANSR